MLLAEALVDPVRAAAWALEWQPVPPSEPRTSNVLREVCRRLWDHDPAACLGWIERMHQENGWRSLAPSRLIFLCVRARRNVPEGNTALLARLFRVYRADSDFTIGLAALRLADLVSGWAPESQAELFRVILEAPPDNHWHSIPREWRNTIRLRLAARLRRLPVPLREELLPRLNQWITPAPPREATDHLE